MPTDSDCRAFAAKMFGKLPKNTISRSYKFTDMRRRSCAKELMQKSNVAKDLERARHCGLIADGRSQANREI